jgi:hypothetical protein
VSIRIPLLEEDVGEKATKALDMLAAITSQDDREARLELAILRLQNLKQHKAPRDRILESTS